MSGSEAASATRRSTPPTPAGRQPGPLRHRATGPRRIAYRTDGVYYDAGVIWRPDRRTSVEGHLGERYGSLSDRRRALSGVAQRRHAGRGL
jgi:hypothetical protein